MTKKPTITSIQLLFLMLGSAAMFPYTFLPVLRTFPHNQDAWIVCLLMLVYIPILGAPLLFLINKFKGLNINEIIELILGKFFGKVAAVIFGTIFLFCYSSCFLMGVIYMNIFMFPGTPSWALMLYMMIPVIYVAFKGAGTLGRLATYVTPFIILTIIFFFIIGIDKMDASALQPILADSTFLDLNKGAFLTSAQYSQTLILFVFAYFLKIKSSINKTYFSSIIAFVIVLLLMVIPTIAVLGLEFAQHSWNPYFTFTRQVETYDFIQRVQSVNTLAWILVMLLKLATYSFMTSYIFAGITKAKSYKKFIIPLAIVVFVFGLLPFMNKSSTIELLRSDNVLPWVISSASFFLPLLIVLIYFIRKNKINLKLRQIKTEKLKINQET